MTVEDLDVLRPEPRIIKLDGNDIDVSFIPCGITFDVDRITSALSKFTNDQIMADPEAAHAAFDLTVEMCAIFCERKYPHMTKEFFYENVDVQQVQHFASAIRDALTRSYKGIHSGESKNAPAPKARKKRT